MAVLVLLRAVVRYRWRSWLLLSLLVALVSGLVLAGAAAGRRSHGLDRGHARRGTVPWR